MIDAYDVLGVSLEASEEEINKAYKKLALQHHPDKQQVGGNSREDAGEKFNEIKLAKDILQDAERRKIYDTFGVDLGEDRPEMEVWTIGLSTLLSPVGLFVLKTACTRFAIWFIGFKWVGRILMGGGGAVAILYGLDARFGSGERELKVRSPELVIPVGIVDAVVLLYWVWPLLADAVGVFYLAYEIIGLPLLVESWKIAAGAAVASLVVAWLSRGWWLWILGLEVVIAVILLAALTVAAGIMRLWLDTVQAQHSEKLRAWRLSMRKERQRLQDEIAQLKQKVNAEEHSGTKG